MKECLNEKHDRVRGVCKFCRLKEKATKDCKHFTWALCFTCERLAQEIAE